MIQERGWLRKVLQKSLSVSTTGQLGSNSRLYRTDLWSSFASVGRIDDKLRNTGDETPGLHVNCHLGGFNWDRNPHCHEHAMMI